MKFEELLPKTLEEVIENYAILYSPECDYIYGITDTDTIQTIQNTYNITEEDEASISADTLLNWKILETETDKDILTIEKIEKIMENLGIQKKEE